MSHYDKSSFSGCRVARSPLWFRAFSTSSLKRPLFACVPRFFPPASQLVSTCSAPPRIAYLASWLPSEHLPTRFPLHRLDELEQPCEIRNEIIAGSYFRQASRTQETRKPMEISFPIHED